MYIFNAVEQIQRTSAQIQELETSIHSYCTFTLLTPTKEMDTISIKCLEYGIYLSHDAIEELVFLIPNCKSFKILLFGHICAQLPMQINMLGSIHIKGQDISTLSQQHSLHNSPSALVKNKNSHTFESNCYAEVK